MNSIRVGMGASLALLAFVIGNAGAALAASAEPAETTVALVGGTLENRKTGEFIAIHCAEITDGRCTGFQFLEIHPGEQDQVRVLNNAPFSGAQVDRIQDYVRKHLARGDRTDFEDFSGFFTIRLVGHWMMGMPNFVLLGLPITVALDIVKDVALDPFVAPAMLIRHVKASSALAHLDQDGKNARFAARRYQRLHYLIDTGVRFEEKGLLRD